MQTQDNGYDESICGLIEKGEPIAIAIMIRDEQEKKHFDAFSNDFVRLPGVTLVSSRLQPDNATEIIFRIDVQLPERRADVTRQLRKLNLKINIS